MRTVIHVVCLSFAHQTEQVRIMPKTCDPDDSSVFVQTVNRDFTTRRFQLQQDELARTSS